MSAGAVTLNDASGLYDFTTAQSQAYGTNPMIDLGSSVFGMIAGDGNGNGVINAIDRNAVWRVQNGTIGYLGGDFNLNSIVNAIDRNGYWRNNNGILTQVP